MLLVQPDGSVSVAASLGTTPGQIYAVPDGTGDVLVPEPAKHKIVTVTPQGHITTRLVVPITPPRHVTGRVTKLAKKHAIAAVRMAQEPVAVASDEFGDIVVGLANGDVEEFYAGLKGAVHLFNLRGIAAIAMDRLGNSYAGSAQFRTVVMHVAATSRDVVVNRNFRSLTGLSSTPSGELWIVDKASIGMWKVTPYPLFTNL
jgi:hypothetical protein